MLDKAQTDKLRKLKQTKDAWAWAVRSIDPKNPNSAARVLIVVDTQAGMVRALVALPRNVTIEELEAITAQSMLDPNAANNDEGMPALPFGLGKLPKKRPTIMWFEDKEWMRQLQPMLEDAGIQTGLSERFEPIDQMLEMFSQFAMSEGLDLEGLGLDDDGAGALVDERVALLEVPNMTLPLAAELYAAATHFYKSKPWQSLVETDLFSVRYDPVSQPSRSYIAVVMGMGGYEFGLAFYHSVEDLNSVLAMNNPDDPDEAARVAPPSMSLTFVMKEDMLKQDVDAQKKHRWALPDKKVHPMLLRLVPNHGLVSPSSEDIEVIAATLRTLPRFIEEHKDDFVSFGDSDEESDAAAEDDAILQPLLETIALPEPYQGATISLAYPVPGVVFPSDDLGAYFEFDEDDEDDEDDDADGGGDDANSSANGVGSGSGSVGPNSNLGDGSRKRRGRLWG